MNLNTSIDKQNWIFSKKQDLIWLIFSSLGGFLIIAIYYSMIKIYHIDKNYTVFILYLLWALLFDGTHAFATYSRTYFDKDFYKQNKAFLLRSFLVFIIGPIFISIYYFFNKDNFNKTSILFILFNRLAICYAYYHLIKQHWGFILIYRKKKNESDPITRKLDGYLLALGTIFPFLHGQIENIEPLHISENLSFTINEWKSTALDLFILGTIFLILSFYKIFKIRVINFNILAKIAIIISFFIYLISFLGINKVLTYTSRLFLIGFFIVLSYYFYLTIKQKKYNLRINFPKWILLFTVIISYNIFFHLKLPILILIACITIFHNLQYHKIIHFHNTNKYKINQKKKYGFAVVLAQKLSVFIVISLLFNVFSYLPRIASNVLIVNPLLNYNLSTFFWGFAFHHYYLDSIIWRIKNNNDLNKSLKIKN